MAWLIAAASIAQSVVLIMSSTHGGTKTGTGFAISSTTNSTQLLTAAHVVEDATASVVFPNGPQGARFTATILRADRLRDIALLEIPVGGIPTLEVGDATTPISGTPVQAAGYPSTKGGPNANPDATPAPLALADYRLIVADGKTDGEAEEGESLLVQMPITHGDSGAPIVETSTGRLVGMVLGRSYGYGVERWMTDDGLGLSLAGIKGFLATAARQPASPPSYVAAVPTATGPEDAAAWKALATSGGFSMTAMGAVDPCRIQSPGPPTANAYIETSLDPANVSIDVMDCSGASFYREGLMADPENRLNAMRLLGRSFLGFADTHFAAWSSLLRYGVAADPAKNPYLALMTVNRNPYGQLEITHTFRGGPAEIAGLAPGDAIMKIDGRPTRSLGAPFIARLLDQPSVTLLVIREGRMFEARLSLRRFSALTANGPVSQGNAQKIP